MQWLTVFPIATALALLFYALLTALAHPPTRAIIGPYLTHPAPPTQQYLYGFDTLRGFAALLVATGHAWNMNQPIFNDLQHSSLFWAHLLGYAAKAVPIFATLSGFLIYRSVVKIDGLPALRRYTTRRIFRIYPVYLVGVLLALSFGLYVDGGELHNAFNYFVADVFMLSPIGWGKSAQVVAWSLYIEEMFYVVLPIIVILLTPKRMRWFSLIGLLVLMMADHHTRSFGLWKYFLFGILAAEFEPWFRKRPTAAYAAFSAGVTLMAADFWFGRKDLIWWFMRDAAGGQTFTLGVACSLILVSLSNLGALSRAFNVLPLRMLGAISFSVFITHRFLIHYMFPNTLTVPDNAARYRLNEAFPAMPTWYLPLVFIPAALFLGLICFLMFERPGVLLGRWVARRIDAPPIDEGGISWTAAAGTSAMPSSTVAVVSPDANETNALEISTARN